MKNRFVELSQKYNSLDSFFVLTGPCVIETEEMVLRIAETIAKLSEKHQIPFVFKASYQKANRTSIESFTGPGLDEGLKILEKARDVSGLPVVTDIHTPQEAKAVGEVVDIVQIPAFLSRQTDLLLEAGKTGKIVNIKKGQFISPQEMKYVAKKVQTTGNDKIMLTERGTFFGYNNLVVDFRGFMEMKQIGFPVVYDVTHSLQKPGASGGVSGGQPEYALAMARAAMATGAVDGLFLETHPDPAKAKSDAKSMLALNKLDNLIMCVKDVKRAIVGSK